jgi:osmoprotectant transport system ATP-binding protein
VVLDGGAVTGVLHTGRVAPAPRPVPLGTSLRDAFAALAGVDTGLVPVMDGDRYVGVVTAESIYQALRRSAHVLAREEAGEEAEDPARTPA